VYCGQRRFVNGHDADFFDYATVDNDNELDVSDERNADLEDEYFATA